MAITVGTRAGTQEEAAEAYDVAAIKFRGLNAVTNFDITRYDVDKIMASNTLLPGDLARRRKDDASDDNPAPAAAAAIAIAEPAAHQPAAGVNDASETWKHVVASAALAAAPRDNHHHRHHDVLSGEAFSVLHDLVATAADGGAGPHHHHHHHAHSAAHHVPMSSATSSLVTSLGNSREGSPDRGGGLSMLFSKPPQAAKPMSPLMPLGSWASATASARAAVSIAHMPVFAAWTDA
jgi:AP2-like factor, ANT lineage